MDKLLETARKTVSGRAYVNENSSRDYLENLLRPTKLKVEIQDVQNILSVTAGARSHDANKGSSKTSGDSNHPGDSTGSWIITLESAIRARKQINSAVQELKKWIRDQVAMPASSILGLGGRQANFVPFLFRGGFEEYFKFLGVIDVLPNDNADWHAYGIATLDDQLAKVVTHRENDNVYNLWGDNLTIGSMLYLVLVRVRKDGKIPPLGLMEDKWKKFRSVWNNFTYELNGDGASEYSHYGERHNPEWFYAGSEGPGHMVDSLKTRSDASFDCCRLDENVYGRHLEDQGYSGLNDYGHFELLPMTWGNRAPDVDDLKYVDIYGNVAVAHPHFVGTIKYDYIAEATNSPYPWGSLMLALGRQSEYGIMPTAEACKIAMMNLPRIPVLIGHKM